MDTIRYREVKLCFDASLSSIVVSVVVVLVVDNVETDVRKSRDYSVFT